MSRDWRTTTAIERLRFLQSEVNASQNKLGERAGVKSGQMSTLAKRLAKSQLIQSRSSLLWKVAKAWNFSPDWLMLGEGQPREKRRTSAPPMQEDAFSYAIRKAAHAEKWDTLDRILEEQKARRQEERERRVQQGNKPGNGPGFEFDDS